MSWQFLGSNQSTQMDSSFSDPVQFFLHVWSTDAYSEFNMKAPFYLHFEQMPGTAQRPLTLTDANFAIKINPSRKYPLCEVETENVFDEDGDPIFQPQLLASPDGSALTPGAKNKEDKNTFIS